MSIARFCRMVKVDTSPFSTQIAYLSFGGRIMQLHSLWMEVPLDFKSLNQTRRLTQSANLRICKPMASIDLKVVGALIDALTTFWKRGASPDWHVTQKIVQSRTLNHNNLLQFFADVYVCCGLLSLLIIKHSLPLAVALKSRKSMHVDRTPCARHFQVAVVAFVKPTRADLDTANIEKTTQAASRKSHNYNPLPSRTHSTPRLLNRSLNKALWKSINKAWCASSPYSTRDYEATYSRLAEPPGISAPMYQQHFRKERQTFSPPEQFPLLALQCTILRRFGRAALRGRKWSYRLQIWGCGC